MPDLVIEALHQALAEQRKHREMFGGDYQNLDLICCQPDGTPIEPNTLSSDFAAFRRRLMYIHL